MTVQEDFWRGEFGASYTARNRVKWSQRVPFWQRTIESLPLWPHTILEVGCNAGWNLNAIRHCDPSIGLVGVDVCQTALNEAEKSGHEVYMMGADHIGALAETYDLVFTAGVLIHIPPEQISDVMDAIIAASNRHVLAIEYVAQTEEEIDYRGHAERLWRRPFGKLYEDKGLTLVETGDAGQGFDRCTYWMMVKP